MMNNNLNNILDLINISNVPGGPYDKVFDECKKYGIEPLVTLCHFEIPLNLVLKYRGWLDRRGIDYFERFAKVVFERYKDKVKYRLIPFIW